MHKNFDHGGQSDGIRVVAIVDHGKSSIVAQHASAHSSRLEARKNFLRFSDSHVPQARCGKSCERIRDVMTPGERKLHPRVALRADEIKLAAVCSVILDIFGAKIRAARKSEGHNTSRRRLGEMRHTRIVGIQHRNALWPYQSLDQFTFGQGDFVNGSEKFQMHRSDARNHAHIRTRDLR